MADLLYSSIALTCLLALGTLSPISRTRSQVGRNGTPCKLSPIGLQERGMARERDATLFVRARTGTATKILLYWASTSYIPFSTPKKSKTGKLISQGSILRLEAHT